jgi:hypothetical protein
MGLDYGPGFHGKKETMVILDGISLAVSKFGGH